MTPVILTKILSDKIYTRFEGTICPSENFAGNMGGPVFDTVKSAISNFGTMTITVDGYSFEYLDGNSIVTVSDGSFGASDDAQIVLSPDHANVYALFSSDQVGSDIFSTDMTMRYYANGAYTDLGGPPNVFTPYSGSADIVGGMSYYDGTGSLTIRRTFGISGGSDRYIAINGAGDDAMTYQINDESDSFSVADFNETFASPYFALAESIMFCEGIAGNPTYITNLNSGTAFFEIQLDDANLQGGTFVGYVGSSYSGMFGSCVYYYVIGLDGLNYILELAQNTYNAFEIDGPVPTAFCRVGGYPGTVYMVGLDSSNPTLLEAYTPTPPSPAQTGFNSYPIGNAPNNPIQKLGCTNYCLPMHRN